MAKCSICGKTPAFGRTIQYNKGGNWARRAQKKNRIFRPNIQTTTLTLEGGVQVQVKACTQCIRTSQKTR
jgi:large subunit ribosomal protein L28